jgi:hypothetical protein
LFVKYVGCAGDTRQTDQRSIFFRSKIVVDPLFICKCIDTNLFEIIINFRIIISIFQYIFLIKNQMLN